MIENTFIFLPGIGPKTERNIWNQGIKTWNDFLGKNRIKGISKGKKILADKQIITAREQLAERNAPYFHGLLPLSEQWRLYDTFREETAFLDIETCGGYGYVTVIGIYDGYEVKHMIRGANLYREALEEELRNYNLLVTFNGASFDIPVINKYFNECVPQIPHMDLRHVCARLGYTGGLKTIEQEMNIRREDEVDGLCGGDAVMLWDRFRATEDDKYLNQLLQYNAEDIINLKPIADRVVPELTQKTFS